MVQLVPGVFDAAAIKQVDARGAATPMAGTSGSKSLVVIHDRILARHQQDGTASRPDSHAGHTAGTGIAQRLSPASWTGDRRPHCRTPTTAPALCQPDRELVQGVCVIRGPLYLAPSRGRRRRAAESGERAPVAESVFAAQRCDDDSIWSLQPQLFAGEAQTEQPGTAGVVFQPSRWIPETPSDRQTHQRPGHCLSAPDGHDCRSTPEFHPINGCLPAHQPGHRTHGRHHHGRWRPGA